MGQKNQWIHLKLQTKTIQVKPQMFEKTFLGRLFCQGSELRWKIKKPRPSHHDGLCLKRKQNKGSLHRGGEEGKLAREVAGTEWGQMREPTEVQRNPLCLQLVDTWILNPLLQVEESMMIQREPGS